MSAEKVQRWLGLYNDPNWLLLPEGALTLAQNVVIDRAGQIEQRPGITQNISSISATAATRRMAPFQSTIVEGIATSGGFSQLLNPVAGVTYVGVFYGPARLDAHPYEMVEARGQLLVTGAHGVVKIRTATDPNSCFAAGVSRLPPPRTTVYAASNWLANGNMVSYRVVLRRTYSDGYSIAGAPSGAQWLTNRSGVAKSGGLYVILKADVPGAVFGGDPQVGDVIEVYRSPQVAFATGIPSDDLQLSVKYEITSADLAAGLVFISDPYPDAYVTQQQFLYTSPSQQGIESAAETPPWCSDMQTVNRLWFYGDVSLRRSWILNMQGPDGYALHGAYVGVHGPGQVTLQLTSGSTSATITAGSCLVGQAVASDGGHPATATSPYQTDTIITSVVGAAVTLSKAALANDAGRSSTTWDVFAVGGRNYYAAAATDTTTREFATAGADAATDVQELCYVINSDSLQPFWAHPLLAGLCGKDGVSGLPSIEFLERRYYTGRMVGETPLVSTVFQSVGAAGKVVYQPQDAYGSTAIRFPTQDLPGAILVSKQDEPEAVPVANLVIVGDAQHRIYRMLPVREAMWIFKEDGLFRVSGTDASNMQVDVLDPSVTLSHSYCADVMDDVIYAWTTQGVQSFSDGGTQELSAPRIGYSLRNVEEALAVHPAYAFGQFVVCDTTASRVLVSTPSGAGSTDAGTNIFCYSTRTGAWTTWNVSACAACYDPAFGRVALDLFRSYTTTEGSTTLRAFSRVRARSDAAYGTDYEEAITVTSSTPVGDGTFTVSFARPTYYIAIVAGDVITNGSGTRCRISSIVSAGTTVSVICTTDPGTGACTLGHSIVAAVAPKPFDLGVWEYGKRARDVRIVFNAMTLCDSMRVSYLASNPPASADAGTSVTIALATETAIQRYVRVGIPRAVGRATRLSVTTLVSQAYSQWALSGVALNWIVGSERVRR